MNNKSNNKKQTTTAKVYIITIGITMILLLIGLLIFISFFLKENNIISEESKSEALDAYKPSNHDAMNVMFGLVSDDELAGIIIMRLCPEDNEIRCLTIPIETYTKLHTKNATLKEHYKKDGIDNLIDAVEQCYGLKIPRYIILDENAFDYITQKLGGVYYQVDRDIYYNNRKTGLVTDFKKADPMRLFYGEDIRKLVTYPKYKEGKLQNSRVFVVLTASLINQSVNYKNEIAQNVDLYVESLLGMAKTNISMQEYKDAKPAIFWIYEHSKMPANVFMPDGKLSESNEFYPKITAKDRIKAYLLG